MDGRDLGRAFEGMIRGVIGIGICLVVAAFTIAFFLGRCSAQHHVELQSPVKISP